MKREHCVMVRLDDEELAKLDRMVKNQRGATRAGWFRWKLQDTSERRKSGSGRKKKVV